MVGKANSPMLVNWLTQQTGVTVTDGPADAEQAVRDNGEDFVLMIDKDFASNFRASRPAPVKIVSNSGRMSTHAKVRRLRALLVRFNAEMASLRLVARGINPVVASPIKMEDVEISTAAQRAAVIFSMISLYLMIGAITAGLQFASDTTAASVSAFFGSAAHQPGTPLAVAGRQMAFRRGASIHRHDRHNDSHGCYPFASFAGRLGGSHPFRLGRMPARSGDRGATWFSHPRPAVFIYPASLKHLRKRKGIWCF